MKKALTVLLITITVMNCKNKEEKTKAVVQDLEEFVAEEETPKPVIDMGCYVYHKDQDEISFKIIHVHDSITGILSYAYAEKDVNNGTFTGKLNDDKLIGTYTFMSEGKTSSREVAFMVKGAFLVEGYGPMNEAGTAFKDYDSISYTSKMPLVNMSCE